MIEAFAIISEKLGAIVPEEDKIMFERTFSLLKQERNVFVFGYNDKAAYREFLQKNKNALRNVAGSVCGQMPELKFKYVPSKKRGKYAKKPAAGTRNYHRGVKNIVVSLICLMLAFIIGIVSVNYIANRKFKENFYSVSLPHTYDNFRIIQLSDIHTSSYGEGNSTLIERITKLSPDIIALTGDCVDQDADIEQTVQLCTALAKIAPTYYIYGNNECEKAFASTMTLEDLDALIGATNGKRDVTKLYALDNGLRDALEETGVKVLFNESDVIEVGTNRIRIFGTLTSNPSAFWDYAGEEFNSFISDNSNEVKIHLCHTPLLMETLDEEEYWGDLVLCGDTHGGVVRLPMFGALYSRDYGFLPEKRGYMMYGKYIVGDSQVIVNSGLENKNPLRIFNQPELVIVDVNKY